MRDRCFICKILVDCLHEHLPDIDKFLILKYWFYNLHPTGMFGQVFPDYPDRILIEEPDCNSPGIWCKAEDVQFFIRICRGVILFIDASHHLPQSAHIIHIPGICPENHHGISYLAVIPVRRKQVIQRGHICIRRIGANRRVVALCFFIRLKGCSVK